MPPHQDVSSGKGEATKPLREACILQAVGWHKAQGEELRKEPCSSARAHTEQQVADRHHHHAQVVTRASNRLESAKPRHYRNQAWNQPEAWTELKPTLQ